jgi:hypothetical protein
LTLLRQHSLSKLSENSHSQQLYDIFLFVILATCFGLYNGHPQRFLQYLNICRNH